MLAGRQSSNGTFVGKDRHVKTIKEWETHVVTTKHLQSMLMGTNGKHVIFVESREKDKFEAEAKRNPS